MSAVIVDRSLKALGLVVCAAVAVITMSTSVVTAPLVAVLVAFVALFWFATSHAPVRWRQVALAAQAVLAIASAAAGLFPRLEGALLAVVVAQTLFALPLRASIAASVIACAVVGILAWHNGAAPALRGVGELAIFAAFATVAFALWERERAARVELGRIHGQLMGTQSLLVDSARTGERLRIARELHDALGHDLVALSLTLEVATRERDNLARVQAALVQTKQLLAHVREIVGEVRPQVSVDLAAALQGLVTGLLPPPEVVLAIPDELGVADELVAHAVFRCTQELLTNALKHARAHRIELAAAIDGDHLRIVVRDDGVARHAPAEGLGLLGVRERLASIGGRLTIESERGLAARVEVPL